MTAKYLRLNAFGWPGKHRWPPGNWIERQVDESCCNDYCCSVATTRAMRARKRNRGAAGPEEAVFLELLRTTDMLSRGLLSILKREDVSATQYNVLRILRGAPEGLPCGEIARRMITRDPDVTRLLDRLEKRDLISRSREARDRRTVIGRITPAGVRLLERLDEPVQKAHRKQLGHLGKERLLELTRLLREARSRESDVFLS